MSLPSTGYTVCAVRRTESCGTALCDLNTRHTGAGDGSGVAAARWWYWWWGQECNDGGFDTGVLQGSCVGPVLFLTFDSIFCFLLEVMRMIWMPAESLCPAQFLFQWSLYGIPLRN